MPRQFDLREVIKRYLKLNPGFDLTDPNQFEPFLTKLQDRGYPGGPHEHMRILIDMKRKYRH